jgi:RNA polymerase sigma factor (sigma-70 family)
MFQAWLAQLVRRLGMDAHRRRNARRRRQPGRAVLPLSSGGSSGAAGESGAARKEPPGKEPTPSAQLSADERAQRVVAAVRAIEDASERSIVELYFFEELTLHQIAERLGMPYWKTKETYRRAIRRLEAALGASL